MSTFAKRIQITSIPRGQAPEEVRRAWVGCILPCLLSDCAHVPVGSRGVVDDKLEKYTGYIVPQAESLRILGEKSQEAFGWWHAHGYPQGKQSFIFHTECATVLETYSVEEIKTLIECSDMETGSPRIPH